MLKKTYEDYRSKGFRTLLFLFNITQNEKNKVIQLIFRSIPKEKIKKYFFPLDYLTAEISKGNKRNI